MVSRKGGLAAGELLIQERTIYEENSDDEGSIRNIEEDGLNFWQTCIALAAIFSGFGTTAVIQVVAYTGWVGILILSALLISMMYTATLLGSCWNMIEKRWCLDRHPYGAIAFEAGGPCARPVSAVSYTTSVLCFIILIVSAVISYDASVHPPPPSFDAWSLSSLCGIAIYIPFVHFTVPVIQRDMRKPKDFNTCVVTTFTITGGIIACAVITGYFSFASLVISSSNKTGVSILYLLPDRVAVISSAVVLVIHSALVIVPQNSPMFQHTEEVLNIPEEFGCKRIAVRTVLVSLQVLCAETVPQFSVLVTLLSAFAAPFLIFIAPPLSYLKLRNMYMPESSSENPFWHRFDTVACILIIALCPVVMGITGYIAIMSIAKGDTLFNSPCYINATAAHI
ncbi:uncharacterized protein LOC117292976 isoform X2 [Asterias rubens]|uniref:uncharacterized protein LOC117292976 isoform X2 n=1 Tax=Asterias rubens TaxID=7604 RepID=UPI0014557C0C|nr:uncharacterized protein LOC117292976 isoform X2 [Asterias rubens]